MRNATAMRITLPLALVLLLALQAPTAELPADAGPVSKGYRIVQPGTRVANGDVVEFYSYWEQSQDEIEVWADLSRLDDTAGEPLPGSYIGDSLVVVGDSASAWPCYRFIWTLAAENGRADAADIHVPVTAVNLATADSTTDEGLAFCLLNYPPLHLGTAFIGDSLRFSEHDGKWIYRVRDGDSLRLETTWSFGSRPFTIEADFSALDVQFDPTDVFYWRTDSLTSTIETYSIYYELSENAHGGNEYPVPVRIAVADGACGTGDYTIEIEVDNQGPGGTPTLHALPDSVTTMQLNISGGAPEGSHDVLVYLNQHVHTALHAFPSGDSLGFEGPLTLEPGINRIAVYARDEIGNTSAAAAEAEVNLYYVPQFKRCVVFSPDSLDADTTMVGAVNGDLIHFKAYWDSRTQYNVYADFRNIDSRGPAQLQGIPTEDLVVNVGGVPETWYGYDFIRSISLDNELPDGKELVVPLIAEDPITGFSDTTEVLQFCLGNHPPRHLWTRIVGDSALFIQRDELLFRVRNSGTITFYTCWEADTSMWIDADFSDADYQFLRGSTPMDKWRVDSLSTDSTRTYGITYRFRSEACCGEGKAAFPLTVYIFVRKDGSCGRDTTSIRIEMDNEPPPGSPWFDPVPPEGTTATELLVSGSAPDSSSSLLLLVDNRDLDSLYSKTTDLEADLTFETTIPLLAGTNYLTAYGLDEVGNRSNPSPEYAIAMVTETEFSFPRPFRPGDEFVLGTLAGWTEVLVEIYNLEGDRIRSWAFTGQPTIYHLRLPWDGRNHAAQAVRQGPYLVRLKSLDVSGRTHEEVRAIVFKK